MIDKRSHSRIGIKMPVCCTAAGFRAASGLATDVSLGGVCVQSQDTFPFGTKVTVITRFPGIAEESRLPGTVRWTSGGRFGVQFGTLQARDVYGLTDLMRSALRTHVRNLRADQSAEAPPESQVRSSQGHANDTEPPVQADSSGDRFRGGR